MARDHHSIGEVLALLREDHPDLAASKIRYLEAQGLVVPERSESGYRRFHDADVRRLHWILDQQRHSYLPLKEIKRLLDENPELIEEPQPGEEAQPGEEPQPGDASLDNTGEDLPGGDRSGEDHTGVYHEGEDHSGEHSEADSAAAKRPSLFEAAEAERHAGSGNGSGSPVGVEGSVSFSAAELAEATQSDISQISELARMGFIVPIKAGYVGGVTSRDNIHDAVFDHKAVLMVRAVQAFAERGMPLRVLRMYKVAADREAGMYEQLAAALIARGDRIRIRAELEELMDLADGIRREFLRLALTPHLD